MAFWKPPSYSYHAVYQFPVNGILCFYDEYLKYVSSTYSIVVPLFT